MCYHGQKTWLPLELSICECQQIFFFLWQINYIWLLYIYSSNSEFPRQESWYSLIRSSSGPSLSLNCQCASNPFPGVPITWPSQPTCPSVSHFPNQPSCVYIRAQLHSKSLVVYFSYALAFQPLFSVCLLEHLPVPQIDESLPDPYQGKLACSDWLPGLTLACLLIQVNKNFYLNLFVCVSCFWGHTCNFSEPLKYNLAEWTPLTRLSKARAAGHKSVPSAALSSNSIPQFSALIQTENLWNLAECFFSLLVMWDNIQHTIHSSNQAEIHF